jgi:hypothetical protein
LNWDLLHALAHSPTARILSLKKFIWPYHYYENMPIFLQAHSWPWDRYSHTAARINCKPVLCRASNGFAECEHGIIFFVRAMTVIWNAHM